MAAVHLVYIFTPYFYIYSIEKNNRVKHLKFIFSTPVQVTHWINGNHRAGIKKVIQGMGSPGPLSTLSAHFQDPKIFVSAFIHHPVRILECELITL